jgi:hypothetical protein
MALLQVSFSKLGLWLVMMLLLPFLNFFQTGKLFKETNATIISLVPKKVSPSSMSDYRPISCFNVIYKCITKILANLLFHCLDSMVSNNQIVFVPNHSITENVLLAQEH